MEPTPPQASLEGVFALFEALGHLVDPGDGVTQLQHALQSAALAREDCCPDALIAACLLHDVGHMIEGIGGESHELVGAAWLAGCFPEQVTEPIRLHAEAKRYLMTRSPSYIEHLSESSLESLKFQGGLMSNEEAAAFERGPHHETSVRLREIDDRAKDPEAGCAPLESWRMLLARLASA